MPINSIVFVFLLLGFVVGASLADTESGELICAPGTHDIDESFEPPAASELDHQMDIARIWLQRLQAGAGYGSVYRLMGVS